MKFVYAFVQIPMDDALDLNDGPMVHRAVTSALGRKPLVLSKDFNYEEVQTAEDDRIRMIDLIEDEDEEDEESEEETVGEQARRLSGADEYRVVSDSDPNGPN